MHLLQIPSSQKTFNKSFDSDDNFNCMLLFIFQCFLIISCIIYLFKNNWRLIGPKQKLKNMIDESGHDKS